MAEKTNRRGDKTEELRTKELWQKFSHSLRGFVRSRVPTGQDAEDVLQDIFMRIHQGTGQIRNRDRVQSWIYGIARRAIADFYRKRVHTNLEELAGTDPELGEEDTNFHNMGDYEGVHDVHEEVLSWLRPMIDELPEKYRMPLWMADIKGKTQQEVADHLGLSLSGAKSRVQRARQLLGEVLAACCEVEFGGEGRAVAFTRLNEDNCESCDN
jgi:RNA polymerase sigma-70 factor (ECF subfamily)